MHIVITDSGLGGLSVCSKLMLLLKKDEAKKTYSDLKITYINATPSEKLGYNDMSMETEKIKTFKKILLNIERIFSPDLIFVACGTLSVLLKDLKKFTDFNIKIEGIISISSKIILNSLKSDSNSKIIIFATPTTIRNNIFQNLLLKNKISIKRIFSQSCPGLATKISNDLEGFNVSKTIQEFVKDSLKNFSVSPNEHLVIFLGCTHFAYREKSFHSSFEHEGYKNINILNPNFASAFFLRNFYCRKRKDLSIKHKKISLKFVSPYIIPEQEKKTLFKLLESDSIETALALQNAIICPELLKD